MEVRLNNGQVLSFQLDPINEGEQAKLIRLPHGFLFIQYLDVLDDDQPLGTESERFMLGPDVELTPIESLAAPGQAPGPGHR